MSTFSNVTNTIGISNSNAISPSRLDSSSTENKRLNSSLDGSPSNITHFSLDLTPNHLNGSSHFEISPKILQSPFLKFKYFTFSIEESINQIINSSKSLYYLDLTGNNINDSIIEKICNQVFLQKHSIMLRHLNLSANSISSLGLNQICNVLDHQAEYLPNLEYLDLSCNSIGDDGAEKLISCLSQKQCLLKSLSIRSNQIKNPQLLMQLALLPKTSLNHELKTIFI